MADQFSFGIEEEYFLINAETREISSNTPDEFFQALGEACGDSVAREFLRSQVEAITAPHTDIAAARAELRGLRHTVSEIAGTYGLGILAAGTHPTAYWHDQHHTEDERYAAVMHDLQMIGQRDMLCGLHVHVELPDPNERIDVMYRVLPYLPLFVALGASSPFWQSQRTGLMGYRLAAYDELPRTGIPELFRTTAEYDAYVDALVRAGVMPDASYIWWAIRPSLKHPTLELRAPDSCTRLDDTLAIAALFRTLVHHLALHPFENWELNAIGRAVIVENKWRAQRYGVHGTFATENGAVTVIDMVDELIATTIESARELGCEKDVRRCRDIARNGTSADEQLRLYYQRRAAGADRDDALTAVTQWLATETLR